MFFAKFSLTAALGLLRVVDIVLEGMVQIWLQVKHIA